MNCCVYMVKSNDETVPEIYIGSTSDYKQRQRAHKSDCNNPNSPNHNCKLYRFIRSKGGFDNFTFEIIEECSNEDKIELEKMYIEMYDPELNTLKYEFDRKEYCENNKDKKKEYDKEYREKNKKKYKEYYKDYNENNKDKLKEYYEKNKEKLKEYKKEYNEKNKEKLAEYYKEKNKEIICCRTCRCEITKVNFKKHCRTKKHISNQTVIS